MKGQDLKAQYPDAKVYPVKSFGFSESAYCINHFLKDAQGFLSAFYKDYTCIRLSHFNLPDEETEVFDDTVAYLVVDRVKEMLEQNAEARIFLEDLPATVGQFKILSETLGDLMEPIYFNNISREDTLLRANERYYCPACNDYFFKALYIRPLTDPFKCPGCGRSELQKRSEDEESAAEERFDVFSKYFEEITSYCSEHGIKIHDSKRIKELEDATVNFIYYFKLV